MNPSLVCQLMSNRHFSLRNGVIFYDVWKLSLAQSPNVQEQMCPGLMSGRESGPLGSGGLSSTLF